MLRNWERNHLVSVPRNPANRYRAYRAAEIGRVRVIRLLRQSGYSPMAILRMLLQLDRVAADQLPSAADLRRALDTPRPDEEAYVAADRWLSTLAEQEQRAGEMITLAEEMAHKNAGA
jgi:DNA-binding transcriptional MerR regulator